MILGSDTSADLFPFIAKKVRYDASFSFFRGAHKWIFEGGFAVCPLCSESIPHDILNIELGIFGKSGLAGRKHGAGHDCGGKGHAV